MKSEKIKEIKFVIKEVVKGLWKDRKALFGLVAIIFYCKVITVALSSLTESTYVFVLTMFYIWSIIKLIPGMFLRYGRWKL